MQVVDEDTLAVVGMLPVQGTLVAEGMLAVGGILLVEGMFAVECTLACLLYTSPSPRDATLSRMPSSA